MALNLVKDGNAKDTFPPSFIPIIVIAIVNVFIIGAVMQSHICLNRNHLFFHVLACS